MELAAVVVELGADDRIVRIEDAPPAMVAELGRAVSGPHHVRQKDSREDAIRSAGRAHARHELFDRVEQLLGLASNEASAPAVRERRPTDGAAR